jgi:hypothetical protein
VPFKGLAYKYTMKQRKLCPECRTNPVAVNYIRNQVTHYRSLCAACIRKRAKLKPEAPAWRRSGYTKKPQCEVCGFKLKLSNQSVVYHVDGNLKNNNWHNLKTVCLNCQQELFTSRLGWRPAKIVPDF